MRRHVREVHHGGRYRCPQFDTCGRDYSNSSALAQHMFVVHGEERIQCPAIHCGRIFHSIEALARHGTHFHPELPPEFFLATRRTRNGEASLPMPGEVTALGSQITPEMFVSAGTLVRYNLTAIDRAAWADAEVDRAELERIDKLSPPYQFNCPWPECTHVAAYRFELCNHYVQTHRTALIEGTFVPKEGAPLIALDATSIAWVPPTSTTIAGSNGARIVPLHVSRGMQGGDSVGVSRKTQDWVTNAGTPIATAPVTEEMKRIGSALHCPVSIATGPIDIPPLRYVSAFRAPRVLETAKPISPMLREQGAKNVFTPIAASGGPPAN